MWYGEYILTFNLVQLTKKYPKKVRAHYSNDKEKVRVHIRNGLNP